MTITQTEIPGAYLIIRKPYVDKRGSFARMFCRNELEAVGINASIAQINLSANNKKGTLRGLHYQLGDAAEDKLVTCISGVIFDVCVDLREDSPTYMEWVGETLSAENGLSLYVPKGCAHGYLSLSDNAGVLYFTTQFYIPNSEGGYRYDDPSFGIKWPLEKPYIMSDKDKNWHHFKEDV